MTQFVELHLQLTYPQLAAVSAALNGTGAVTPTAAEKPAAKPKAEKAEEPKGKTVEEVPQEAEPLAADVPSKEDVTAAAQALVAANGREALAELLEQLGAKNLSSIPDDKKAEFIGKCEEKTK